MGSHSQVSGSMNKGQEHLLRCIVQRNEQETKLHIKCWSTEGRATSVVGNAKLIYAM